MIVVAGESLVDLLVEPTMRVVAAPGGGPFNTARTIARLGGDVALLSRLSSDRFGTEARRRLVEDGVRVDLVEATDDPTTLAVAELDDAGHATYRFYVDGTAAPGLSGGAVAGALAVRPLAVHVGTLGLVLEPMASALDGLVAGLDPSTLLMIDVNARPTATPDPSAYRDRVTRILARADVAKASVDDLAFLYPGLDADEALARIAGAGPSAVLLTDGGGPVVLALGAARVELPSPRVEVVDTVGAGDAFGGGVLHAWLHDGGTRDGLRDIDAVARAVEYGIRVAGITVGRAGADPPTAAEVGPRR